VSVDAIAQEALREWKRDPVRMAWDLFRFVPDRWQDRGLRAFADPAANRIAFQACVGPGKSAVESICGWNFLLCYSDGENHPNGAAMSVTSDNLQNNLWKELAVWRDKSPILQREFEMTAERIFSREFPKTWFLNARSWSKSANPDEQGRTLSGLHAKSILYLIDEAGDIAPAVLRAAEQGLSNCAWGKILMAGNPTSLEGMLYAAVTEQSHLWHVIPITGDPDDPERSPRISKEWASEQIALYGRDNPWVMASILGKFPPSSLNALLGPDDVRTAMARHLRTDEYEYVQKRLGIDVARFGDDSTVIFPRQGRAAFEPVEMRNARTDEIAARIAAAKAKWGSEFEMIDDTGGHGAGVIDALRLGGIGLLPINASSKPDDPRFYNKRAETTFRAAQWIKSGGGALPNLPRFIKEAVAASRYTYKNGKFIVLEKEQIKTDLKGHSPDFWDAFCLTFALVDMPSNTSAGSLIGAGGSRGHAQTEYDPFDPERWGQ
jgi:hypothetical protein